MISPLAHIHPTANIGSDVTIDPFTIIGEGVSIGDGTHIMSHVTIMQGTSIGKNCIIFPGAVIGAIPQDLKFDGEITTVEIGDNNTIREFVTINRGTKDRNKTVVGNNCLLMAYSHLAHDCIIGNNVILANAVQLAGHVTVGDYAIIGGMAAAIQFATIGAHTYIAGNTEIRKDVPPYIKAGRAPLSYVGLNSVGLQRRGFTTEKINEILEIYRQLYIRGLNTTQALENIEKDLPASQEKDEIVNFIKASKRGIVKVFGKGRNDED
ncbi:MAG: acyl-ACP--UDP-N-acetylglucosamine O-acyltransferase [Chitinophagaceae bacterium]|nr:acyl-ACP--UDP-N-acetylglucosamine O-acyltransferase [Chitinophagaceae bacterium]